MLANRPLCAYLTLTSTVAPACDASSPAPGRPKMKRRTSVVFDVKLMEDHVYVVVDEEDLVKSHLLLAVREEVDVLKASITKLVDKINVLERENEVLRNHAPAEVLAQLEPATVQQPAQQFQSPPQQFQPAAVSPTPATPAAVAPPPQQPPPPPSSGV